MCDLELLQSLHAGDRFRVPLHTRRKKAPLSRTEPTALLSVSSNKPRMVVCSNDIRVLLSHAGPLVLATHSVSRSVAGPSRRAERSPSAATSAASAAA